MNRLSSQAVRSGFSLGAGYVLAASLLLTGCPGVSGNDTNMAGIPADLLVITAEDHVLSAGTPKLAVIEYVDFECPVCGRFFWETYPVIRRDYIDTGKVRWVVRQFPLRSIHPQAQLAAQASECAAQQGAFFAYHDALFEHQNALAGDDLKTYAAQIGLDAGAFDACLDTGATLPAVQQDVDGANRIPVTGTPTFLIGDQVVVGFRTAEQFAALLDAALAE